MSVITQIIISSIISFITILIIYLLIREDSMGKTPEAILDNCCKKFNKLITYIKPSTIEATKEKLLKIIDIYESTKLSEYKKTNKILDESIDKVNNAIIKLDYSKDTQKSRLKDVIKSENADDKELAAQYYYHIKLINSNLDHLREVQHKLKCNRAMIVNSYQLFELKMTIKRSEVATLICNNFSSTDEDELTLNDLMSEFETEIDNKKIELDVKSTVSSTRTPMDDLAEFSKCKEELENLSNEDFFKL